MKKYPQPAGPQEELPTNRNDEVARRLVELASDFPRYLQVFDEQVPFAKAGQYDYHLATIRARREFGSAVKAIDDDRFLDQLRDTLLSWGIGVRGSHLLLLPEFCEAIRAKKDEIRSLDGLCIDDPALDLDRVVPRLWRLLDGLRVVENDARLVSGTKALHHLLPDLVMPMDRMYTRVFFHCYPNQFHYRQRAFFERAFRSLAELARKVAPAQYVGDGWRTSRTKVIDNALIGYCKEHKVWLY